MTKRHPDPADVMAWTDRELTAAEAAAVESHVAGCADCRAMADGFQAVRDRAAHWRVEPPPASLAAAVAGAVQARRSSASPMARSSRWRRYGWQLAAAAVVVVGVALAREVSVCGEALCTRSRPPSLVDVAAGGGARPAQAPADDNFTRWWEALPRVDLQVPADGAKVTIVWFLDYECPACAASDPVYGPLLDRIAAEHPGEVKLVTRDWPWNATCNPWVPKTFTGHEASCAAAAAVHLARAYGTEAAMVSWLFTHQGGTTVDEVRQAARDVGQVTDFDARYPAEVEAMRSELASLGSVVQATPSCFVNGRLASEGGGRLLSPQNLQRAIEDELDGGHAPR